MELLFINAQLVSTEQDKKKGKKNKRSSDSPGRKKIIQFWMNSYRSVSEIWELKNISLIRFSLVYFYSEEFST